MWAVAPTNKIGERQPLRRADNAGAGSSRLAGYGIAVPKHGAVVFGNSEHVSGSGSPGSGSVQEPIPTTAAVELWPPDRVRRVSSVCRSRKAVSGLVSAGSADDCDVHRVFSNDFGVAMAFIIGDLSLHMSQWFSLIIGDLYCRQC
ncbi:uncharacterized protein LOC127837036 [Dreissena polymorpha]|uniref:uncharacterized protein LOC127837036 n=1 Tax=Dreissena polymorpha TaxID=45954 RepID=UPI002264030E|nr:uncharacterized protein LOC127837036 [Dreissena polymorpha]